MNAILRTSLSVAAMAAALVVAPWGAGSSAFADAAAAHPYVFADINVSNASFVITINGMPQQVRTAGTSSNQMINGDVREGSNTIEVRCDPADAAGSAREATEVSISVKRRDIDPAQPRAASEPTVLADTETVILPAGDQARTASVLVRCRFTLRDFPVKTLPWDEVVARKMSDDDQKAIRALLMELVDAYRAKAGDRLADLYAAKYKHFALSTGKSLDDVLAGQRAMEKKLFDDPVYTVTVPDAGKLQLTPVEGTALVRVSAPDGQPAVQIKMKDATTFKSEVLVGFLNGKWHVLR